MRVDPHSVYKILQHATTFHRHCDHFYRRRHYATVCPIQDLFENPSSTLETLPHRHLPFNRKNSCLGSCNGLVCFQDSCVDDEFEFEEYWFWMWNPATRVMSNESPHIRLNRSDYEYPFWWVYGFGYDEWSDTYQVVLLDNKNNQSQKLEVKVCSLGDNCWRNTLTCDAVPFLFEHRLRGIVGALVSGTLNWLAYPKSRAGENVPEVAESTQADMQRALSSQSTSRSSSALNLLPPVQESTEAEMQRALSSQSTSRSSSALNLLPPVQESTEAEMQRALSSQRNPYAANRSKSHLLKPRHSPPQRHHRPPNRSNSSCNFFEWVDEGDFEMEGSLQRKSEEVEVCIENVVLDLRKKKDNHVLYSVCVEDKTGVIPSSFSVRTTTPTELATPFSRPKASPTKPLINRLIAGDRLLYVFSSCEVFSTQKSNQTIFRVSPLIPKSTFKIRYRTKHYAIVCPIQDLFENPSSTLETLPHRHLPFNRKNSFLGSCNGLVCLQDSCVDDEFEFEEYWFWMGNPATRVMSNESPHIRVNRSDYEYPFWLVYGFGYDEWSDTYQVVLLDNNKNQSQKLEVKVCSLEDNCWRNTLTCDAVPILMDRRLRGICGAFVCGTLNWLAYPKSRADMICMREKDDVVLLADTGLESKSEFIWWNIRDNRMEGREIYDKDKFNLSSYDYVHSLVLPYKN
ncbi:uncharacterized protein HKW66_Vig0185070 [Vigna angularis]|uniref:F-box associated domain-containing protein n=1 Tax=Phaseolus angularis TaxID=3914 RepID=A0A8T0KUT1_PHAAN|nr:uncharacterized protein HKW66_Vig0185070 [Vigna angularis]